MTLRSWPSILLTVQYSAHTTLLKIYCKLRVFSKYQPYSGLSEIRCIPADRSGSGETCPPAYSPPRQLGLPERLTSGNHLDTPLHVTVSGPSPGPVRDLLQGPVSGSVQGPVQDAAPGPVQGLVPAQYLAHYKAHGRPNIRY
jgi:hypothetical protein